MQSLNNSDSVISSETQKKIRNNYFKNDATVKTYKCDLTFQGVVTPMKLYICNANLNFVHLPKRKKLTTLPFGLIDNIKVLDRHEINIYTINKDVYTLNNFDRTDSAVAFLRNYWDLIRKEKTRPQLPNISSSSSGFGNSLQIYNSQSQLSSSVCTNQNDKSFNSVLNDSTNIGPITLSFTTSQSSPSEEESTDGVEIKSDKIKPIGEKLNPSKLIENSMNKELIKTISSNQWNDKNDFEKNNLMISSLPINLEKFNKSTINNLIKSSTLQNPPNYDNLGLSNQVKQTNLSTENKNSNNTTKVGNISNNITATTTTTTTTTTNVANITNFNATISSVKKLNHLNHKQHLVDKSESNWWPINLIPYSFSSTPSKCTMFIAYAILGFLLLSTMHLYHRLAVIDLQTGPALRRANMKTYPTIKSFSDLENLELQISHLTELATTMIENLGSLTNQLNDLFVQTSSHHTTINHNQHDDTHNTQNNINNNNHVNHNNIMSPESSLQQSNDL